MDGRGRKAVGRSGRRMKLIIDIPEEVYKSIQYNDYCGISNADMYNAVKNGIPLSKGHSFIAICNSDFPITEEIKQVLKDTAFVGNEEYNYCFDMTEILDAESEGK